MTSSRPRGIIRTLPHLYLDVGAVEHNLLRGGNSSSGISSLWSTGGMNNEGGSGGRGDDGNGNDAGTRGDELPS
ncbi:hypothetical protein Tco_1290807 [Tanacetum coccineum]